MDQHTREFELDLHLLPSGARPDVPTNLLAVLLIAVPMAAITAWVASTGESITLRTMFLGPLVFGTLLTGWTVALHVRLCRDHLRSLGVSHRDWCKQGALGLAFGLVLLVYQGLFRATVAPLLPPRPAVPQILELLEGVVRDPLLLALWLGPVVWIGVALFEEVVRVFLLRRLWLVWPAPSGRWVAIVVVSAFVGFGHLYQGSAAMVSIGIKSVLMGAWYLRRGRLFELIVAHAVYDSVQIGMAVVQIRGAS